VVKTNHVAALVGSHGLDVEFTRIAAIGPNVVGVKGDGEPHDYFCRHVAANRSDCQHIAYAIY